MAFSLPQFNVVYSIWYSPNAPPAAADAAGMGQLYFNSKGLFDITPGVHAEWEPPIYLRVPKGTRVGENDTVEVPTASGWQYHVRWVDRVHLGFANEYFVAVLEHSLVPSPPPPPGAFAILMEGSGYVLTESGFHILLE